MQRADGKLFGVLADHVCRDLLLALLGSDSPLTQTQLVAKLGISSGVVSRRMGELEGVGLVDRGSAHAPYDLPFPAETRQLLLDGARLAAGALRRRSDEAEAYARELQKDSMAGGIIRDRAKESA
jgi:DNA-binding Lrp family transcriptional regulator